jgi:Fe-S cluster assembly protein SufD
MNAGLSPLELFRSKGVPGRRVEEWKYSDLRSVLDAEAVESTFGAGLSVRVPKPAETLVATEDLPAWSRNRFQSMAGKGAMDAAARAFDRTRMVLYVPPGVRLDEPIRLDVTTPGHGAVTLVVDAGASLTLEETHHSAGAGLQNVSFSIALGEGAQLTHVRCTPYAADLITVETISIIQEKNSLYRAHFLQGGAKLSRTELNIELSGEGAEADLGGVSVLGDRAHADVTTLINHASPCTTSRQLFKKIAGGRSRAIYQGKIKVHEGAIGSDSRQTAKAILLSRHAEADLKPELEILADDVKCAHGAAVGDLDAESLFYLRSRGIPEEESRVLLVEAFLKEVIDGIEDEGTRNAAIKFVENGMARAMIEAP